MTRTSTRLRRALLGAIAVTSAIPFVLAAETPSASAAPVKPRVSLLGDSTMMAMLSSVLRSASVSSMRSTNVPP